MLEILQTFGFPVASCCVLAYYVTYLTQQYHQLITRINEQHFEEMDNMLEAINNNTQVLEALRADLKKG